MMSEFEQQVLEALDDLKADVAEVKAVAEDNNSRLDRLETMVAHMSHELCPIEDERPVIVSDSSKILPFTQPAVATLD